MVKFSARHAANHWMKLNHLIWNFKIIIIALLVSQFLLVGSLLYALNKDTLVVGLSENENLYFVGQRHSVEVTEGDVIELSKRFITDRYNWKSFDIDKIIRDLSPISTYGFIKEMMGQLEKSRAFIEKNKISQDVIITSIKLVDGKVIAKLDRVVAVGKKVKAVRPLEVHLEIIKESQNKWNKKALYVNSLTEIER